VLKRATGLGDTDIGQLYLSGGFGNYLDVHSPVRIGLIPPIGTERISYVGNAAADGGPRVLVSEAAQARAKAVARSARHVTLATYPGFQEILAEAVTVPGAAGAPVEAAS